jgi:hypothetical protein
MLFPCCWLQEGVLCRRDNLETWMVRQLLLIHMFLCSASRALAMAIDAARKLKRTDIVHSLCYIISVLEPLAPDPAHWQQPPVDARLKDLSEEQVTIHLNSRTVASARMRPGGSNSSLHITDEPAALQLLPCAPGVLFISCWSYANRVAV